MGRPFWQSDPWIPGLPSFRCRENNLLEEDMKVEHFLSSNGGWNEGQIRHIFPVVEPEAILDIPLNRQGGDDVRFWLGSKNEKYSVKLGYMQESKCLDPPLFQSVQPNQQWWNNLWKLNIPPKIRIFVWRASMDFIPTAINLLNHHVPINDLCSLCKFPYATTSNCLLFCPAIRHIWKIFLSGPRLKKLRMTTFFIVLFTFSRSVHVRSLSCLLLVLGLYGMKYVGSHMIVEQGKILFVVWIGL